MSQLLHYTPIIPRATHAFYALLVKQFRCYSKVRGYFRNRSYWIITEVNSVVRKSTSDPTFLTAHFELLVNAVDELNPSSMKLGRTT